MRTIGFLALPLALSACTSSVDSYPTLLPRPIETRDAGEPIYPDPVATPDSALDAKIAKILASAQAVAVRFNALARESESRIAVARGVPVGAESWVTAQMSLATLSRARGESVAMASDVELMAAERIQRGIARYPALDQAVATLTAQVDRQSQQISALETALVN